MAGQQAFSSQGAFRAAALRRPAAPRRAGRALAVAVRNERVLIVNCKSGGHAFVGLYLARQLLAKGHQVTILNAGDKSIEAKGPFAQYPALESQGVRIVYGVPEDPRTYPYGDFDVVYDNNGKSMEECKALIDTYASRVKHYVFMGSAGAYAANDVEPMHVEGDERKAKAGHVAVEKYLEHVDAPFTVFQPLYMYGAHTAKDCEQYFIDRIVRGRPVCIPAPGNQLTSVSNVEDVAAMLAAVPGNDLAIGQHYNACGDRTITLTGMAKMIAAALNTEAKIVLYDEKKVDIPKGKGFPFRSVHFFASVDKAKFELDWQPQHTFASDVKGLVDRYMESGRARKDMSFEVDDLILRSV